MHSSSSLLLKVPFLSNDPHYEHVNGTIIIVSLIAILSFFIYFRIRNRLETFVVPPKRVNIFSIIDFGIEGLYNLVKNTVGSTKYFPYISSIFIFIFFNNLLGLIPHCSAPTSHMSTNLGLGLATFIYYNTQGIRSQGMKGYFKHFLCGLGIAGIPIAILEMFSHIVRPFSLSIRLLVNMYVDHSLVLSFQNLFAWGITIPLLLFGIIVCTVQAFVFTILTAVYVQMATEHTEH